ncbi:ABC transporter substrate-binding protein [Burkholderiaceae bacterium DAT-1]|nr:ABC transporter substrate-binding protein [Burkholderiaceae bacterium DAT-1]
MPGIAWIIPVLLSLITFGQVSAESGITENEIILGQSAALTGPAAELGKGVSRGAKAYFDWINQKGGVNGRKIRLISFDDGYEPERAEANTRRLIERDGVFALFGYVGTPTSNASLPLVNQEKIPFIGAYTGADSLRNPFNKYIFNVRAGYKDEAVHVVNSLIQMGLKSVNVFYQNDSYGNAGLKAIQLAAVGKDVQINALATVQRNSVDVAKAIDELIVKRPAQAVFMVSSYKSCAAFIAAARAKNFIGPFYNVSFVGTEALIDELHKDTSGVMVTQVMPSPYNPTLPITIEYKKVLAAAGMTKVDYMSLEGFIAAKVMVEGLKRSGRGVTRERLISVMETLSDYDLGGFRIKFSNSNHNGSQYVDFTILDKDGHIHS